MPITANTCSSSVNDVHAAAVSCGLSGHSFLNTTLTWRPSIPPFLLTLPTSALRIFSASPCVKSTNCAMHAKSTTTTPILISVAVIPRNDAVSGAAEDDAPDAPDDPVFLLSLLHALNNRSAVNATTTPDLTRTMDAPHRVVALTPPSALMHCRRIRR